MRPPLLLLTDLPVGGQHEQLGAIQGEAAGRLGKDEIGTNHKAEPSPIGINIDETEAGTVDLAFLSQKMHFVVGGHDIALRPQAGNAVV